jgi:hypothetical protein
MVDILPGRSLSCVSPADPGLDYSPYVQDMLTFSSVQISRTRRDKKTSICHNGHQPPIKAA